MKAPEPSRALALWFVTMIAIVPLVQIAVEFRRGDLEVPSVFREPPTKDSIGAFEGALEEKSVTVQTLRPWVQSAHFFLLRDGGAKVLVGRNGWLFYAPGVNGITQRRGRDDTSVSEALAAVIAFHAALNERGIRLIVMPVPNKESVYPQWLSGVAKPPERMINPDIREFLEGCRAAGVETVDLYEAYRMASRVPYYLAQDTHWSPVGLAIAAQMVAERIGPRGTEPYETETVSLARHGDLVSVMESPPLEAWLAPESIEATRVLGMTHAEESSVLVLGDSFCRIFETVEPGSAGFLSHLARYLGQPVASLVSDGGSSTLVRQELYRRPGLLTKAKVVVWEFTERDLRSGMEGWQIIPLPEKVSPVKTGSD